MTNARQDRVVLGGAERPVKPFPPYAKKIPISSDRPQAALDPTVVATSASNFQLFGDRLRPCIVTLQRHRGAAAYFASQRFQTRDGTIIVDEY